jgi:CP family cyanate transporter-like MFS transporter
MLVAVSLRPAVTTLAPVLPEIMRDTGLDAAGASLLATAPVLCLGLFGAVAPAVVRALGLERGILLIVAAISLGCLLRGVGTVSALAVGGILGGAGIGIGNVVMPSLIKRDFPGHAAPMTGFYTMGLCAGAAAGSGLTVPLMHLAGGSWSVALGFWGFPALLALFVADWAWRGRLLVSARGHRIASGDSAGPGLLNNALAWQVTLFMALQSVIAWSVLGWLAPILRDRGDDPTTAGLVVAVAIAGQIGFALPAPILGARLPRQSEPAALVMAMIVAGLLGLLFAPLAWQWAMALLLGLGMGGALGLAMIIIILRSPDAPTAARLSGMAQSIGYTVASGGPFLVGVLHDATGDWRGTAALCVVCGAGGAAAGALAGRRRVLGLVPKARPTASVKQ